MNGDGPIALRLFDRVDEYAASIRNGSVTTRSPLKQDTPIIVFCQNFFAQFFDNVVRHPITGFHPAAQRDAVRVRSSLTGPGEAPKRQVIAKFEKFCEMWSNLGAGGYSSSRQEFLEFHRLYVPRLLLTITAWAAPAGYQAVADRSQLAHDGYQVAVALLEEAPGDG